MVVDVFRFRLVGVWGGGICVYSVIYYRILVVRRLKEITEFDNSKVIIKFGKISFRSGFGDRCWILKI